MIRGVDHRWPFEKSTFVRGPVGYHDRCAIPACTPDIRPPDGRMSGCVRERPCEVHHWSSVHVNSYKHRPRVDSKVPMLE